ncbi:MAG: tetratricopeptide repeat protein [Spirochaetaceae bacterium]
MKRYRSAFRVIVVSILLVVVPAATVTAQMDMLPQIFRDLPPELQQGLPLEMTHEEYRQVNRNVDFFTMFMSMFVPGYGMFQVERPVLGWSIVAGRSAGAGMMAAAVVRQWNDFRDLSDLSALDEFSYRRVIENAFLFGGGIFVNGMLWALDVVGAYHIAKTERDFVIYQYGMREGIADRFDESLEEQDIEFIRRLVLQDRPGERQIRSELHRALSRYAEQYPEGEYRGEVEYYRGSLAMEEERFEEALLYFTRQFFFFPDERYSTVSRRTAVGIVQAQRNRYSADWELLLDMMEVDGEALSAGGERESRVTEYLEAFAELESPVFRRLYVQEALDVARRNPDASYAPAALFGAARQLELLAEPDRAVQVYTMLAAAHPDAAEWDEAVLRIAEILYHDFNEPQYAERFYRRLGLDLPSEG